MNESVNFLVLLDLLNKHELTSYYDHLPKEGRLRKYRVEMEATLLDFIQDELKAVQCEIERRIEFLNEIDI